ncbi:uncharacterized protein LOC5577234 [Aedes aegypti]|uniref:F-box domain-containing protein n=1 Tax=Aedes aegypti TaxID=7159 RepID=A0A1S4F3V8_AEDAE|nr:uncharacterized protein LOC5577234 [Aedes aegypti]XP_021707247.1 uncharacterized protein LOC5577234 [Aedes aegypti]
MDLDALPPELVWHILDNLTELRDRKNASLVCKGWNWMLFNSPVVLRAVRLRVCPKVASLERTDAEEVFNQMSDVMVHSKRNYSNVEFFHVNFERPMARELLFFMVQLCCDSIESLAFTNCHGLRRSELWQVLELLPWLTELMISGGIYYDEFDNDAKVTELNRLESLSLDIGDDCRLYQDFLTITPSLSKFSVRTIHGCVDLRDVVLTRYFSQQLNTLSFITSRCFNHSEFSDMNFANLTKLNLKLSGSVWPQLFKQMKLLNELHIDAGINDEVIAAICGTSTKLRKLSLLCSGFVECKKFNMLSRLEHLEDLQLRGIYKFSWRHVTFSKLRRLHVDNVATDFTNFLKELTTLKSLEIHDTKLKNEQLIKFTLNAPTIERLELAFCNKLSDKAFKHLADMPDLEELRLWAINVSKTIDERMICPKLKKVIFYFNDNIEDSTLEALAKKLPHLRLLVLYDCYRISPQGVADLRKTMPNCNVLELYRGDELPPALVAERQIYYRNAEFPNGVLKQELPFQWY